MIEELLIHNIGELADSVSQIHNRFGERLWYRGQSDADRGLIPSILRPEYTKANERHLSNAFRIRANRVLDNAPQKEDYSAWLSLMQHYGLPTRMLDWSASPLVAAFFATEKEKRTDSCIWVLRPRLLNKTEIGDDRLYPADSRLANRLLRCAFAGDTKLTDQEKDIVMACHSTQKDLRMYAQQSCFTIHNSYRTIEGINCANLLFKLIIPNENRKNIRDSINALGISRSYCFPDLENIALDLKGDKNDWL